MEWIDKLGGIVTIIGTLTVGGIIGTIISLKYKGKTERAKADQEAAKADLQEEQVRQLKFSTTKDAIEIYKEALDEVRREKEADKLEYETKLQDYNNKLEEVYEKLNRLTIQLESQNEAIKVKDITLTEMTKAQLKLKLELDLVKASMTDNCESCSFKKSCEKYNAKCLMSEDNIK